MLKPISPSFFIKKGIVALIKIKNISSKDIGKSLYIFLKKVNDKCNDEGLIWTSSISLKEDEVLVVIDKVLSNGDYLLEVRYNTSSSQRRIHLTKDVIYIGLPYSCYPSLEIIL